MFIFSFFIYYTNLYEYTKIYFSSIVLNDIWVVSNFQLRRIMLLGPCVQVCSEHICTFTTGAMIKNGSTAYMVSHGYC